ncbi:MULTISPECIES: bifunctional riboflavin kinase/FAD synthetase [Kocuria]|uniref:Riboflavin biosynthesis protein n=1 Tax=Kocuria subflava TaxID=1736139 RepID=A0A846TSC8_9MICC|nr:bifunctional riboflavin kinase/FAD synthetase [Kocuria sp. CPCC 104605]NKE09729.1 bifunctional riboflavin kinase/FAD synthetase [Kocuria subflava]
MHRYHSLTEVPEDFGPSVVTVGNFDGVHRGHQEVLKKLVEMAREQQRQAVVLTFDPHPAEVHRPETHRGKIMGTRDKLDAMEALGLDAVLVQHYNLDFAGQSPEQFVTDFLRAGLHAECVVVGADTRFGHENSGDVNVLRSLGEQQGFDVVVVEDLEGELVGEDSDRRISSTWIRELLSRGEVAESAAMLGRPHRVRGTVVHGAARGRELGFPTANLDSEADGYVPDDGVYAGWLHDATDRRWPVAVSVGSNPTFEGVSRVVEAHVIDRPVERVEDFDLYGQEVVVEFVQRLRGMVAYEGVEKLIEQMTKDVEQTRQILKAS